MLEDDAQNPTPEVTPTEEPKEDALAKLGETLNSITSRLDQFETKLEELPSRVTPNLSPKDEDGFVTKDWAPSEDKGWNDVFSKAEEIADKKFDAKLEAWQKEQAEKAAAQQAENDKYQKMIDDQVDALVSAGRLPKIEDENNPNDPGRLAKKELFQLGVDYGSTNLLKMADLRDKLKGQAPAGVDAPIGSSSKTTNAKETPTYDYINSKTMEQMIRDEFGK